MLIGYFVVDLVTPGKLHELLWQERSKNAAILVGSSLLAVAIVVATAIRASADDFVLGLLTTFVFGLLGIVLQALSFLAINLLRHRALTRRWSTRRHPPGRCRLRRRLHRHLAHHGLRDPVTAVRMGEEPESPAQTLSPYDRGSPGSPSCSRCSCARRAGWSYELALVALGSYLLGNTIVQGVDRPVRHGLRDGRRISSRRRAWCAGPPSASRSSRPRWGWSAACPVLSLYLAFAFLDAYTVAMVVAAFVIGALIGAEIPCCMEILQRIRAQRASSAVADLFSFDYVGRAGRADWRSRSSCCRCWGSPRRGTRCGCGRTRSPASGGPLGCSRHAHHGS